MGERRVYKYALEITDLAYVAMPEGARVLTVQFQHGALNVWALVDPSRRPVQRRFRIAGTGHPVESGFDYIGTVQQVGGALVWHVFLEPEANPDVVR